MSGRKSNECPFEELNNPGSVKCLILVYEGFDACNKIREVLGPTDPSKAPEGTVRREFGRDIMVNTAHASDSPENALREMEIVNFNSNECATIIKEYLESNARLKAIAFGLIAKFKSRFFHELKVYFKRIVIPIKEPIAPVKTSLQKWFEHLPLKQQWLLPL